jgi:hypothetical protein
MVHCVDGRLDAGAGICRDGEPADRPRAGLETVRNQVLHLGGGCGMAVDDVALGEAQRAEEAQGHCDGGGDDQELRRGLLRSLQRFG